MSGHCRTPENGIVVGCEQGRIMPSFEDFNSPNRYSLSIGELERARRLGEEILETDHADWVLYPYCQSRDVG